MAELATDPNQARGEDFGLPDAKGSADTISALDTLAAELTETPTDKPDPDSGEVVDETPVAPKAAADAAPEVKPDAAPAQKPDAAPEVKPDAAPADKPADQTAKEEFDKVELPPHSKPKTAEAFATVKEKARQTISTLRTDLTSRDAKIAELAQENERLKTQAGNLTPEIETELTDLRKFKLSHDVKSDPTFKQFDTDINSNNDSVLKKLKEAGADEAAIAKIKELGVENVNWDKVLATFPMQTKRYIESKLVENETLREKREAALTKAQENATQFLSEREGRQAKILTETANNYLKDIAFTGQKKIPADATPEVKAKLEAENKVAQSYLSTVQGLLKSYNPQTFAELAVCAIIAQQQKADLTSEKARSADLSKQLETLTKQRDELQGKLDGIKRAAVPRAAGEIRPPAQAKPATINMNGADALDALAREAEAQLADN